jgi:hypothetical protein
VYPTVERKSSEELEGILARADQAVRNSAIDQATILLLQFLAHAELNRHDALEDVWQKLEEVNARLESLQSSDESSTSPTPTPGSSSSPTGETDPGRPDSEEAAPSPS